MDIAIEKLPPYEQISNQPIREAVAAFDAAKAGLQERRRDLVELEQTRESAEWKDAEAAERARAEGKPEPKRSAVAAHDRKTDEARHEHKVTQLAADRARTDLLAALEQHGEAWRKEVAETIDGLRAEWQATVSELTALHGQLSGAASVARIVLGGHQAGVACLTFTPSQVQGREWAPGQPATVRPIVQTGDALAALADLGKPEPVDEKPAHPMEQLAAPTSHGSPMLRGRGDVEAEIAERRQFAEATATATSD